MDGRLAGRGAGEISGTPSNKKCANFMTTTMKII
jgi:hypothetical protein